MINYTFELDIVKVDGATREYSTLYIQSNTAVPTFADTPYARRIDASGLPSVVKEVQNIFYGTTSRNFGQIVINNGDGKYNYLISEGWTLENRPFRLKKGETNELETTYETVLDGKTGSQSFTSNNITIELNDGTLDLTTVSHIDKVNVVTTVSDAVNNIISAASLEQDASVATWLTTYGSISILLNFTGLTLGSVLDQILTPLRSYYGFNSDGEIFIKRFELPSGTPVETLGERDVLDGFNRTEINRNYWRITGQYWTLDGGNYVTNVVTSYDGVDVNGAAASVDGGNKTGIPATSHGYQVGDSVRIYDDDTYQGSYIVQAETTTNQVVINKAYFANTFADAIIRNTTQYPYAQDGYAINGLFTSQTDAQDAVDDWLTFLQVPRYKYTVTTKTQRVDDVNSLVLGAVVSLDLPQPYGSVDVVITKNATNISINTINLECIA